jgi:hypothetical protein
MDQTRDIKLSDINTKRQVLENDIAALLNKFNRETGLSVSDVVLKHAATGDRSLLVLKYRVEVKVEI